MGTVSIHAPTRGATRGCSLYQCHLACFNPRSHTGSDLMSISSIARQNVSIHAPTRGATVHVYGIHPYQAVSIHAPTRGATFVAKSTIAQIWFQSTLPHGERHDQHRFPFQRNRFQSTLPHGERQKILKPSSCMIGFNPRSHTGSD